MRLRLWRCNGADLWHYHVMCKGKGVILVFSFCLTRVNGSSFRTGAGDSAALTLIISVVLLGVLGSYHWFQYLILLVYDRQRERLYRPSPVHSAKFRNKNKKATLSTRLTRMDLSLDPAELEQLSSKIPESRYSLTAIAHPVLLNGAAHAPSTEWGSAVCDEKRLLRGFVRRTNTNRRRRDRTEHRLLRSGSLSSKIYENPVIVCFIFCRLGAPLVKPSVLCDFFSVFLGDSGVAR